MESGIVIAFIELLQNITTSSYSAIAIAYTLQLTTACGISSKYAPFLPVVA
jgi:hypothetical protein